jgi:DNA-directed RNA polymerase beta subunit
MAEIGAVIQQIITQQYQIVQSAFAPAHGSHIRGEKIGIKYIGYTLNFTSASMKDKSKPGDSIYSNILLDPVYCMQNKLSYVSEVYISCLLTVNITTMDGKTIRHNYTIPETFCFNIPIDIGGARCFYRNLSREQIYNMGGDLDFLKGLFCIGGVLYSIHTSEKLKFNGQQVYHNKFQKEIARGNTLTRQTAFSNSFQVLLKISKSMYGPSIITIEITLRPFLGFEMPIHLFYYMLGVTTDEAIHDMIMMGANSENLAQTLRDSYETAVRDPKFKDAFGNREPKRVMAWFCGMYLGRGVFEALDQNGKNKHINDVEFMLNNNFLVNQTMAGCVVGGEEHMTLTNLRMKKTMILSSMIRDMIMVTERDELGTDRDHVADKRYHTPLTLLSRFFKHEFNEVLVDRLKTRLKSDLEATNYAALDFVQIISDTILSRASTLSQMFENEIKAVHDKDVGNSRQIIHSEMVAPAKSALHYISTKRTIVSTGIQSKQSARATEMRQVHASFLDFLDYITSAETGEKVGMHKNLAVLTTVTIYKDPKELAGLVAAYPNLVPWSQITSKEMREYMSVLINGDWFGGLRNVNRDWFVFLRHFRKMRREGKFDKSISIRFIPMSSRIEFWTDDGRLIRPFFIVYNNKEDIERYDFELRQRIRRGDLSVEDARAESAKNRPAFHQWINYTREIHDKIVRGELEFNYLIEHNILENIAAEEAMNCYVARTHEELWVNRMNEMKEFTHMTIPMSSFGVPALAASLPHMSNPTRACFLTSMAKQGMGYITFMEPYLNVKQMHTQMVAFTPCNPTFASAITNPGGAPAVVCFLCFDSNQDDSLVFNEAPILRGGFASTTIDKITVECSSNDMSFGLPTNFSAPLNQANYGKLRGNIHVPIGTIIEENDVIVAKFLTQTLESGEKRIVDLSEIYKHHEPAYVTQVFQFTQDSSTFVTVQYRILRVPNIGSKFASTCGNKGVISKILPQHLLPYGLVSGVIPDIYINPHSFPTRILPGEIMSDLIGTLSAMTRTVNMVTPFMEINFDELFARVKALGKNSYGLENMRDGASGIITRPVFWSYTTRQFLQKFAEAEASARTTGQLSKATRQSLPGKKYNGGQRTGEMELWVMGGQGCMDTLYESICYRNTYFELIICTRCKQRSIYNEEKNIYLCLKCKENTRLVRVPTKFMTNSLISLVEFAGLNMSIIPDPYVVQKMIQGAS